MSAAEVTATTPTSTPLPSEQQSRDPSIPPDSRPLDVAPSTPPESLRVSPSPEAALPQDVPQSQPMTATASTSSQNPAPDNGDGSSAAPYGTRSRNRTGGARPNYADDKELDLEIEAAGRISKTTSKKAVAAAAANASSATESLEVPNGSAAINGTSQLNGDTPSQTATAAATPSAVPAPSKKRKQPGSSTTVSTPGSVLTLGPRSRNNLSHSYVETNMLSFSRCGSRLNAKQQLVADDGTALSANDHVYFVCEPPGEPYYLARIMEFLYVNNDPTAPIDAMRVNWYYRPKDIGRRVQDTRVVFASMHSDHCPLTSIRGKCIIQHLSEISSLDEYRVRKDSFWFDKLYDRYMHRYYEVVPTSKVVNVPQRVKLVLDERWKFVLIEVGRGRDLTSASKKCIKCEQFAANHDSVDCAVCKNTYHMRCVRPPLLKKPARGFAWACAACSRAQELRLEARNTPAVSESAQAGDEDELMEDEDDDAAQREQDTRESSAVPEPHPPPTAAQIAQANLWPWRYLGVHSRVEDALDYDDRIYPRASSRLGPRHQANVNVWHGRPVQLVKPAEIKRKYLKPAGPKKDGKFAKEAVTAVDSDRDSKLKRPKWVVDEPVGYVARGQDEPVEVKGKKEHTAQLTFKMPDPSKFTERGTDDTVQPASVDDLVDDYMKRVKPLAAQYRVQDCSTDFLTKAVEKLTESDYNVERALEAMNNLSLKADLKQPDLNKEEIKRFEEGVAKYGSELHAVARHVGGNVKEARIVRFYYMWKKTENGRQIWGSYEGRRSKKESKRMDKDGTGKLVDDVADDADDSAFDNEKAVTKKRGFECKFCATRSSRQWRRAPGTAPGTLVPIDPALKTSKDKSNWLTLALCGRCAYLWRRYAIQYESIEEISKKIAAAGGRASKRRIDEELLRTIFEAQHESGDLISMHLANEVVKSGMEVPPNIVQQEEQPKKKPKTDKDPSASTPEAVPEKKKAVQEKLPEAPLEPEPPRVKVHPCAVCNIIELQGQELLKCRDCRLHVHGSCYGVEPNAATRPWFCDMCRNDHNLQVSTIYECLLCPVTYTPQELMEPPRASHKKKTDREREKERLEREMVQEAGRRWRQEQEAAGRPVNPREALKRTAWNNWVHITCALWTKEIKFGNANLLDSAEGIGFIPRERYEPACKICKQAGYKPTVQCHMSTCNAQFHVGCAHQAEYIFGFDVALVKGSRRDSVNVMKLDQETGVVSAGIWCPNHAPTTYVHSMLEPTEGGLTALQLFARTYKQADQSITGTVRRAAQFTANLPTTAAAVQPPQRQTSMLNGASMGSASHPEIVAARNIVTSPMLESPRSEDDMQVDNEVDTARTRNDKQGDSDSQRKCCTCLVEVSPRWWPSHRTAHNRSLTPQLVNGSSGTASFDRQAINGISQSGASPHVHSSHNSFAGSHGDTTMTNGIVKTEPAEYTGVGAAPEVKKDDMYQCHKCHVQKRSPPSSPSQVKPKPTYRTETVPDSPFQAPVFPPPPPISYPYPRPQLDGPPAHSHPVPPPIVTQHSPWQGGPPQWSPPVLRNGPPAPGGAIYPPQPPQYRPTEYTSQYSTRPGPSSYSTVPPPLPPPPPPSAMPQHSPPPGPYGVLPHHQHPPHPAHPPPPTSLSGRPPSPPRYGSERPTQPSPRLGLGPSSYLSRPYSHEPHRPGSMDSPVNGYGPPPPARPYGQPPPQLMRPTSSQAQSLAQIARAASEQSSGHHSRNASSDGVARMMGIGGSGRIPESPTRRPITPADGPGREEFRAGPGASASPSVRNLLS